MVLPSSLKNNESAIENPALEEERKCVGLLLKAAREEKNLSFEDVVAAIRIRKLYLIALESGDLKALPGRAYVIGFIRSYASYLQMDENELLRRLNLLVSASPKPSAPPFRVNVNNQIIPPRFIALSFSVLGGLLMGGLFWYKYFPSEPASFVDFSENQSGQYILHSSQNSLVQETEKAHVEEKTFDSQTLPKSELSDNETFSVFTPLEKLAFEEDSLNQNPVSLEGALEKTGPLQPREHQPIASEDLSSSLLESIEIQAIEDTWVQVLSGEGEIIYMRVMKPGDSYKISADKEAVLNTGNAAGVRILVDKDLFPPLGSKGAVLKGIALQPQSIREFYQKKSSYVIVN